MPSWSGEHVETWGEAFELTANSNLIEFGCVCPACGQLMKVGQYARFRYSPHGGTALHDDCTSAHKGDEEAVICGRGNYCQFKGK